MAREVKKMIRSIILEQEELFTGTDIARAVHRRIGLDYRKECFEVLDSLLDKRLIEYVGENEEDRSLYKVSF